MKSSNIDESNESEEQYCQVIIQKDKKDKHKEHVCGRPIPCRYHTKRNLSINPSSVVPLQPSLPSRNVPDAKKNTGTNNFLGAPGFVRRIISRASLRALRRHKVYPENGGRKRLSKTVKLRITK